MTISIVIATYNRATLLADCLKSLADQRFIGGDEVIVVDNGSTDGTSRVIEMSRPRFAVPVRHLNEKRPGKSHAIAAAMAVASGDVLALTDDDVTVDAGWLLEIRRIMRDSNAALIGGPVIPRWEASPPRWLRFEAAEYGRLAAPLGLLNYGPAPLELGPRTVLGANMAIRRTSINKVGGFALHLGKLRGTLLSGEDHELCQRVQAAGLKAMYQPELRVSHWVPADRMRASYSMSWFYWSGITHAMLDAGSTRQTWVFRVPGHFLKRAVVSGIRGIGAAVLGRPARVMDQATEVAFVAGYAARRWKLKGAVAPASPRSAEVQP